MKKITIAIDGTSSTGKSTLAKLIANQLGYVYVDTGAMYRMIALYAMREGFISANHFDTQALITVLPKIRTAFKYNTILGFSEAYLNDENVEKEIRSITVSNYVSKVASLSEVRQQLVRQQQQVGKDKGVVMDGRDIGTVVFPDAEVKLFVVAQAEVRAQRRFEELQEKGLEANYQEVLTNIQERDYLDMNRADSPLVKANDATEIDNSFLTKETYLQTAMQIIQTKLTH